MSGMCSAHQYYERHCPQCQSEKPGWVVMLESTNAGLAESLADYQSRNKAEYERAEGLSEELTRLGEQLRKEQDEHFILFAQYRARIKDLEGRVETLRDWVHDLQSGMWINCVYCGHRYGPNDSHRATPVELLTAHVETCEEHPLYKMREALRETILYLDAQDDDTVVEITWHEADARKLAGLEQP